MKPQTAQHTPTPWGWKDANPTVILDASFHVLAECFKENKNENAAFVVRAVNHFDELRQTLKDVLAHSELQSGELRERASRILEATK